MTVCEKKYCEMQDAYRKMQEYRMRNDADMARFWHSVGDAIEKKLRGMRVADLKEEA